MANDNVERVRKLSAQKKGGNVVDNFVNGTVEYEAKKAEEKGKPMTELEKQQRANVIYQNLEYGVRSD
jgi:hypothetical protein